MATTYRNNNNNNNISKFWNNNNNNTKFSWDFTSEISPEVKNHLRNVYASLFCTLLMASFGSYFYLEYQMGYMLATIGSFIGIMLVSFIQEQTTRFLSLMFTGFCVGLSLGPLIVLALKTDPSLVIIALTSTTIVFGCFTIAALAAKRRSYLYLGGILSSVLSMLFWISIMNMLFFHNEAVVMAKTYLGLVLFCGYVVYDTQLIIEKASLGDRNFISHSLILFLDFVNIFVRVLIILIKNSNKKKDRK
eukprot:TRINITY_DN6130_c1_g3_i2.p1 TRINITY_DN6130_c1_g3~~TRINITY_DN6130_c1_g3_i2.p1  ORF type:complete len:248 (-),score=61.08 TRINITY_DN6130_c1_g3_i2:124-867(-)